ncbi:MAG: efflux RND transporter permease subunit [Lachnospiraceae bacterium]|nr:efflux RND transporter permease subunit [Lachnospiraceae bacterium]
MIAKFSVKKAYTVIVGIILVIILGVVAYTKMTVDLLPDMELPYAVVITTYPGASPEAVETSVTKPIEQAVATIDNIKNLQSVSSENYSMVVLEFNSDTNMDTATIDMREKLDQVSGYFDDSVSSPMIMKLNPNMMPVMVAAVDLEGADTVELSDYVENNIAPSIEGIEGVASVTTMGTVEESVQVMIREDKVKKANEKIQKALDQKFEDAGKAIADGKSEISSGKSKLATGQRKASEQFAKAQIKIDDAKYELLSSEKEIQEAKKQLEEQEKTLQEQKTQLAQAIQSLQELLAGYQQMKANKEQLTALLAANPDDEASKAQLEAIQAAMTKMETQLASQTDQNGAALTFASLPAYISYLQSSQTQIESGLTEIAKGKQKLKQAENKISKGKQQIDDGYSRLKTKENETNSEMTKAQVQLEQGEEKIAEQEDNLDSAKETAYDNADLNNIITTSMIEGILTAQNFDYPAGYVTEDDVDYLVRVGDKFDDVESLSDFVLLDMGMDDVDPIKLSDVADVVEVNDSDKIYTKVNDNPGVILSIAKQNEYSTKSVSDRLKDKFEELHKQDDKVSFTTLMDQGMYIDLVVNSVLSNLVMGAILAVIILIFFLKDIRPTGIIAVSIPVSVIFAIVLMYFSGITLNVISLSGLALGVGMLVDNSIVVIENIYRLRKDGYSVKDASIEGAKQMTGAITASTLTTVCVFLPIVFTSGITKQLFTDMGLTIAYSLLASLIVAVTFVPMVASKTFDHVSEKENKTVNRISDFYARHLDTILNHKGIVLAGVVVLLVVSAGLALSRGFSFFPSMDSTQMSMTLTMPEGTKTLEETADMSDQVIDSVLEIEDIETVGAMLSGSSMSMIGLGSDDSIDTVSYYIECKQDKKHTNDEIAEMILDKTKDYDCEISVSASTMDMSSMMTEGVVVQIKGKDLDELQKLAQTVGDKLEGVDGLTEMDNGLTDSTPEYRLVVDKDKAAEYGLTVAQVYQAVQEKLKESSLATTLTTTSKDYPVYVKDEEQESYTLDDVKNIEIEGTKGEEKKQVKVKQIAEVQDANSLASINRLNQTRYISVSAKVKDGYTTTAVSGEVKKALKKVELPEGYSIVYDGENETVMEAMNQVILMLILALAFMYLIMVAQFQSLKGPFIIMFTIPLAFTGGFAALFLAGKDVSIIAMIGMVMLCGVIVNNGIVFVDSVNQLREMGLEIREAIIQTGRKRLRPIVMTALTTILGLSTMAMGIGMGADMAQPMALVVIGGLIYGTVLTLAVVPCIYEMFYHKESDKQRFNTDEAENVD